LALLLHSISSRWAETRRADFLFFFRSCRNGDTAAIDVSPDGKKLFIEDNHEADDDVPVYNPMRQYDEDVIDEGDEEDEFSLPADQRRE